MMKRRSDNFYVWLYCGTVFGLLGLALVLLGLGLVHASQITAGVFGAVFFAGVVWIWREESREAKEKGSMR